MTDTPQQVLERLFMALDRNDPEAILLEMGPDVAMVDEISRCWLRGIEAVATQLRAVVPVTSGLSSTVKDLHTRPLGPEAVLVSAWLDQSYTLDGQTQMISAPLSACLEARDGRWLVVSLHAIPLPEAQP